MSAAESRDAFRPTRNELSDFIVSQVIGVLSTLDSSGAPMSATVAFSVTETGKLLVGTSETSAKSQNIDRDPRVAVTMTDVGTRYTMQLQGRARKLDSREFAEQYAERHYRQRPESLPFKDKPGQCHILITPTRIKFSDCGVSPWAVTEFDA